MDPQEVLEQILSTIKWPPNLASAECAAYTGTDMASRGNHMAYIVINYAADFSDSTTLTLHIS